MIVDSVSPTPFALLRRAKHFEYRDDDPALQDFSDYEDPVQALTEECQRVLRSISSTNQSSISASVASANLPDASWSRFEDVGFGGLGDYSDQEVEEDWHMLSQRRKTSQNLFSTPQSKFHDAGRPTTPSWADFLSSGFVDEPRDGGPAPLLLPHDKVLPPIDVGRAQSPMSFGRNADAASKLEPGELASINTVQLDDSFWWVWITSLAGEETPERKAVYGRCALIETTISGGKWLIMEEIVRGAAPEPKEGAYIAEKKSRFGFSKKGRLTRSKSLTKKPAPHLSSDPFSRKTQAPPVGKSNIGPDQHARIQAAAAALQRRQKQQNDQKNGPRRARKEDEASTKTNSVFTLQPVIMTEAAPAMKWANTYDKDAIRAAYLGNNYSGKGSTTDLSGPRGLNTAQEANGFITPSEKDAIYNPNSNPVAHTSELPRNASGYFGKNPQMGRDLPALPSDTPEQQSPIIPFGEQKPVLSASPRRQDHEMLDPNNVAKQAAEVSLPVATPMESHHLNPEKPLPPVGDKDIGPNGFAYDVAESHVQEPNGTSSSHSSPDGKKDKKITKYQGAGLKGIFGRKKSGVPASPAPLQPADSAAVAAARAAYVGPQMKPNFNVSQTSLGRRLSTLGRKRTTGMPNGTSPSPAHEFDAPKHPKPPSPLSKRLEPNNSTRAMLNPVNNSERQPTEHGFRSFDQGPLLDQPAFVPEDPPDQRISGSSTPPGPKLETQPVETLPEKDMESNRSGHSRPADTDDQDPTVNEGRVTRDSTHSGTDRSASPALDRWAQIKKNAAERVAQQRKEQSRSRAANGVDDDDDADTDEETGGADSKLQFPVRPYRISKSRSD